AAESPSEMALVKEKYGTTTVAHLDRIGFLGPRLTLAHAIWLSDDEIATIAARGVGTAHCPSSNMKLASGVSPVPKLRKAGGRAGLGAEGAGRPTAPRARASSRAASRRFRSSGRPACARASGRTGRRATTTWTCSRR